MPIKVYDLAKEFKISNTEMMKALAKLGYERLSPSSDLDDAQANKARVALGEGSGGNGTGPSSNSNGSGASSGGSGDSSGGSNTIEVPSNITIKDLAERFGVAGSDIQKILVQMGVLAALNQRLASDAIQRIAAKLGKTVHIAGGGPIPASPTAAPDVAPAAPGTAAPQERNGGPAAPTAPPVATTNGAGRGTATPTVSGAKPKTVATGSRSVATKGRGPQDLVTRPPVVTIMGHVDHGKTTLLDAIRKSEVAAGEAGGITQHIGAYQVEVNGQRITFIDTPGHAAFSAMRNRGASVTDIIVIVVAADDSVMPQTEEALQIAKDSGLPYIIAVNKIDAPGADPTRVLTDLTRYDVLVEAYGGEIQSVNLSAKTREGIQDLLDTILLVSEAVVEPKADPHGKAQGTVIEAKLEKGRGAVATVLVQQGTLLQGDVVVAGTFYGRIKGMTDDRGSRLAKAGPSTPVEIIGLNGVPDAGDRIEVAKDEKEARSLAQQREDDLREARLGERNLVSLEALYRQLREGPVKELNIVIKGDVQGSVQAIRDSLTELGNDEVRARILSTGVGAVSESDILLAASDKEADAQNSLVLAFNVGLANGVDKKAEQEHVTVKQFAIIYELIDAVKEGMVALLPPIYEESALGKATVRQLFNLPGARKIAGSYVTEGILRRNAKARLIRGRDVLYTGDIDTLKRFKDDVREVAVNYECGLTLSGFNDIQVDDVIECFEMRQIPREL